MTEVLELKEELLQIKNNNYAVPEDVDAYPYAQWMLDYIHHLMLNYVMI